MRQGSAQITGGEREEAIRTLRSALELWRGPALSDFAYEEFAQPYVRRFHDLHLDAIETLAAAELEAGQTATVVPLLEAAIREDPLRERSRELLMVALYRSGRHAEALRSYEKLRELLVEELGLEPSPPLQQLRDRVLLHDPSLLPAPMREPARGTARNPYKGLQPFGEEDADDFFGRDAIVERLLAALADGQRLIGLVGPSGSGKSSIVAAGLLPRLRHGGVPGSDRWVIAPVALGPDPLADLRAVLARIGKGKVGDDLALPSLADGERVVVVLDQFEQLFTAARGVAAQPVPARPGRSPRRRRRPPRRGPHAAGRLLRPAAPASRVRRGLRAGRRPRPADDRARAGGGGRRAGRAGGRHGRAAASSPSSSPSRWPGPAACRCSSTP